MRISAFIPVIIALITVASCRKPPVSKPPGPPAKSPAVTYIDLSGESISFGQSRSDTTDKPGDAAAPTPEWTSFTTANSALPDDRINALAIDRNNVKWLGTSKGLVRMSSSNFTVFTPADSPLPGW